MRQGTQVGIFAVPIPKRRSLMKANRERAFRFLFVLVLFLPTACAGLQSHGKLRLQPQGKDRVTIEQLVEEWQGYDIHYAGINVNKPSAVLFDPKGDDRSLQVHPWWIKVNRKETLVEIIRWLEFDKHFEPLVWRVLGPDDRFFGYMFTAWTHALIRVVDENTLWVNDLSMPPDYPAGGNTEVGGGP